MYWQWLWPISGGSDAGKQTQSRDSDRRSLFHKDANISATLKDKTWKLLLKQLYTSDISDIEKYQPEEEDNFGFVLRALVRPTGQPVEESFDITVCTPRWLAKRLVG
jgi:hypothetical protein